ncbi:MAG: hypothetical protein U0R19_37900 [Bryobacteraceae bacterium]
MEKKQKELEILRNQISDLLCSPLGHIRQVTVAQNRERIERLVDTLAQFIELSNEARELEKDVFAEVIASFQVRPETFVSETSAHVVKAIFEWVPDLRLLPAGHQDGNQ